MQQQLLDTIMLQQTVGSPLDRTWLRQDCRHIPLPDLVEVLLGQHTRPVGIVTIETVTLYLRLSHVCPEPVLVNRRLLYKNYNKKEP